MNLDMKRYIVRAGLEEGPKVPLRLRQHQVHVKELVREFINCADDVRPKRDVRHEVAVHDVEVEHVGAGTLGIGDLFRQP